MKKILLLSLPVILSVQVLRVNAQVKMTAKEMEKHEKEIQKSKEKGTSIWDWDTVYNNGIPYCIIYEVKKSPGQPHDFSIRSLTGKELIYVHYGTYQDLTAPHQPNTPIPTYGYYLYVFDSTKQAAEVPNNRPFKEVVRNNLIDNGTAVDSAAEAKFVARFQRRHSLPPPSAPVPAAPHTP